MSNIQIHRADWLLPMSAPEIRGGGIALENDTLLAFGSLEDLRSRFPTAKDIDHGVAIILPGLVNAHTHLSLTHLGGFEAGGGITEWLGRLTRAASEMTEDDVRESVRMGLAESWTLGTVLLGEITTRSEGIRGILEHGQMLARVYFEFLGVSETQARSRFETARGNALALLEDPLVTGVLPGLSPHAPYSVWPDLWDEMLTFTRKYKVHWSTHFAEPPGEREFLTQGSGPLRDFLVSMGVWDGAFPFPEKPSLDFLEDRNALDEHSLLVHCLHLTGPEIARIGTSGASVCLCPRSNQYLGLPPPPVTELAAGGANLCLGTDSLASNEDLSVWAEMRAVRSLAPELPAKDILLMATTNGAAALGMSHLAGTLHPGLPARALVVNAEGIGDDDPYDFLVSEPVEIRVRHLGSL